MTDGDTVNRMRRLLKVLENGAMKLKQFVTYSEEDRAATMYHSAAWLLVHMEALLDGPHEETPDMAMPADGWFAWILERAHEALESPISAADRVGLEVLAETFRGIREAVSRTPALEVYNNLLKDASKQSPTPFAYFDYIYEGHLKKLLRGYTDNEPEYACRIYAITDLGLVAMKQSRDGNGLLDSVKFRESSIPALFSFISEECTRFVEERPQETCERRMRAEVATVLRAIRSKAHAIVQKVEHGSLDPSDASSLSTEDDDYTGPPGAGGPRLNPRYGGNSSGPWRSLNSARDSESEASSGGGGPATSQLGRDGLGHTAHRRLKTIVEQINKETSTNSQCDKPSVKQMEQLKEQLMEQLMEMKYIDNSQCDKASLKQMEHLIEQLMEHLIEMKCTVSTGLPSSSIDLESSMSSMTEESSKVDGHYEHLEFNVKVLNGPMAGEELKIEMDSHTEFPAFAIRELVAEKLSESDAAFYGEAESAMGRLRLKLNGVEVNHQESYLGPTRSLTAEVVEHDWQDIVSRWPKDGLRTFIEDISQKRVAQDPEAVWGDRAEFNEIIRFFNSLRTGKRTRGTRNADSDEISEVLEVAQEASMVTGASPARTLQALQDEFGKMM